MTQLVHRLLAAVRRSTPATRAGAAFVLGVAALTAVLGLAGPTATAAGPDRAPQTHPRTIVEVTGDAANGFGVHYFDGTEIFPPTDSEARAECSEYDTRLARVKCRVEVATYYRDLAELKRSLAYAYAH